MKEFLNPKNNQENLSEQMKNIQEVFLISPELKEIGTEQDYAKYLEGIFPESKTKTIVWHGTVASFADEKFSKDKIGEFGGDGFHFTTDKKYIDKHYDNGHKYAVLLDIKNPELKKYPKGDFTKNLIASAKKEGKDGVINDKAIDLIGTDTGIDQEIIEEFVVFEPEQIHILGSRSDIQGFREFMSHKTT